MCPGKKEKSLRIRYYKLQFKLYICADNGNYKELNSVTFKQYHQCTTVKFNSLKKKDNQVIGSFTKNKRFIH